MKKSVPLAIFALSAVVLAGCDSRPDPSTAGFIPGPPPGYIPAPASGPVYFQPNQPTFVPIQRNEYEPIRATPVVDYNEVSTYSQMADRAFARGDIAGGMMADQLHQNHQRLKAKLKSR